MHVLSLLSIVFHILLFSPLHFLLQIASTIFLPITVITRHVCKFLSIFVYLLPSVLSRLEAIYIYCGTAAILGIAMGTLLGLTAYLFAGALGLRDEGGVDGISCAASSTSSSSHNISQKRRFSPAPAKSMLGQQHQLSISRMLIPPPIPTILEEEDEDPPFLFGGYAGRRNGVDTLWIDGSGDSSGR